MTVKLCRETNEEEGVSAAPAFEDIPEEPEDALDRGFFGMFDEVDSMMGRHRRPRRVTRSVSLDPRGSSGHLKSRWAHMDQPPHIVRAALATTKAGRLTLVKLAVATYHLAL